MRWTLAASVLALCVFGARGLSDEPDKKDKDKAGPLVLQLVAKKTTFAWDRDGQTPAEFKKLLKEAAEAIKNGKPATPPKAPAVDFTLKITNTSKEDVTIYVGGDPNVYTFHLKGPGVITLNNPIALTADFKLPRGMTLAPGKSYEVPVRNLVDGLRGVSRLVYWTEPGDYTLTVTYQLATQGGERAAVLKSAAVKLKVEKAK